MPDKNIHIKYYALMREERGQSDETVLTKAETAAELYEQLRQKHPFSLKKEMLRAAVNQEYVAWDAPLHDQDEVVFIPPVNGG